MTRAEDSRGGRLSRAQPVERATWSTGELEVWIRHNGEWLGKFRDKNGELAWVPGKDLRPL